MRLSNVVRKYLHVTYYALAARSTTLQVRKQVEGPLTAVVAADVGWPYDRSVECIRWGFKSLPSDSADGTEKHGMTSSRMQPKRLKPTEKPAELN